MSSCKPALRRPATVALGLGSLVLGGAAALVPTAASAATSSTDVANPDTHTCAHPGYIGFEELPDQTNLSTGSISGVQFTTTGGFTWQVGDFASGGYNGKYPSGGYTSHGTHWAWLGTAQGSGRIDFVNGPASYFSLLASANTPVVVEAYDAAGVLLETTPSSGTNINTGHMAELAVSRPSADIAYVIVHDSGNFFLVDDICTDAPGVNVPADTPPTIAVDNASVVVDEGSSASNTGTLDDVDGDAVTLSASVGTVTDTGSGTWSWSHTPTDGPADSGTVTITATANGASSDATFALDVTNVAPTITSLTASPPVALSGQDVTFTGVASDPSSVDTTSGFEWAFDGGAYQPADSAGISFTDCGEHTVSATARDKDGGVSAPAASSAVTVADAGFLSPLVAGSYNKVQAGRVVPVKIGVGCDGVFETGLAPTIQLLAGDLDPTTDPGDGSADVATVSVSHADTSGVMREADGHYLYNLRVPEDAPSGTRYTIRVRPYGSAATGSRYVVLQVR